MYSRHPNSFFRATVKAIIRDADNRILVVKEGGDDWSLPGGGINHGESAEDALARELFEETAISEPFTAKILGTETIAVPRLESWMLWILYEVTFDTTYTYGIGSDSEDVAFMDIGLFEKSNDQYTQILYKWASK